jgi:hypothetical protein
MMHGSGVDVDVHQNNRENLGTSLHGYRVRARSALFA